MGRRLKVSGGGVESGGGGNGWNMCFVYMFVNHRRL